MSTHPVTIDDFAAVELPDLMTYSNFVVHPEARELLALAPAATGRRSLVAIELDTLAERVLVEPPEAGPLDLVEELRQERTRQRTTGVTGFWLFGADSVLVSEQGTYRVIALEDGSTRAGFDLSELVAAAPLGREAIVGSTGTELVLIEEGSRRVLVSVVGEGQQVGVPEYVAAEELDRSEGLWPDPSGRFILYAEVDESAVTLHPITHLEAHPNWVEWHRFPFAGSANAVVTLCVFDRESHTRRPVASFGDDGYLLGVQWLADGTALVVQTDRAQRELVRQRLDPATGELAVWHRTTVRPWVEPPIPHCARGAEVLTTAVGDDGETRLALLDATGTLEVVCEQPIDTLLELDPSGARALVLLPAGAVPATEVAIVELATGTTRRLGPAEGKPVALWDRGEIVCRRSSLDHPPEVVIVGGETPRLVDAARPSIDVVLPEHLVLEATTGEELHGLVYLPPDPTGAPLVVSVYGGPSVQTVGDSYSSTADLVTQWLVAHGAVVLKLDNRGSARRGLRFASYVEGRFGKIEVEDQLLGVRTVLDRYGCDASRVGICGWSYGGYMTLMSMLGHPEVYSVGVAGAPVVEWRWYDTAYTERYLGRPEEHREAYDASSPLGLLPRLEGRLLIIHGMLDENVHVGHSLAFVEHARRLGKEVELVLVRSSRHGPRSPEDRLAVARARLDFFARHLGLADVQGS